MLMGDSFTILQLKAELQHLRNDKDRLQTLAAAGPGGIEKEIQRLEQREKLLIAEIEVEESYEEPTQK